MRFIVREQPTETPIAAGLLRYERDGAPTGAVEHWRLTRPLAGYEVLRVDLDAREADSGHTYLYHLVRQENGRPDRLAYRFWGDGLRVAGTLLFDDTSITGTRSVNDVTYEEDMDLAAGIGFWFPSSVGLGLLAGFEGGTAVTLDSASREPSAVFRLQVVETAVTRGEASELTVAGKPVTVRPFTLRWAASERTVWLDERQWPMKMKRDDGLTAVETRAIRYRV